MTERSNNQVKQLCELQQSVCSKIVDNTFCALSHKTSSYYDETNRKEETHWYPVTNALI